MGEPHPNSPVPPHRAKIPTLAILFPSRTRADKYDLLRCGDFRLSGHAVNLHPTPAHPVAFTYDASDLWCTSPCIMAVLCGDIGKCRAKPKPLGLSCGCFTAIHMEQLSSDERVASGKKEPCSAHLKLRISGNTKKKF